MFLNPLFLNFRLSIPTLGFLGQVVAAFLAFTGSSSGVEQVFSQLKRSPIELASSAPDTDRRLAAVIGSSVDKSQEEELLQNARSIFSRLTKTGKSRTSQRTIRIDCGRKGVQNVKTKKSEKQWMRDRKAAVEKAADELTTPPRTVAFKDLSESGQKECRRQDNEGKKRKVDALANGLLVQEDVLDISAAKKSLSKRLATHASNDAKRAKQCQIRTQAVNMTLTKQTRSWAVDDLPPCAYLVDAEDPGRQCLQAVGVRRTTTDSCLIQNHFVDLVCMFFTIHPSSFLPLV